jgi:hypothetical protein
VRIEPAVTTAVTSTVKQVGDRVETARTQWVNVGGRMEQQTAYYYYTVYDRTGNIVDTTGTKDKGQSLDQMA